MPPNDTATKTATAAQKTAAEKTSNFRKKLSLPLAELMAPTLKPLLQKRGLTNIRMLQEWESIVGRTLFPYCKPERIRFSRNQKTGGTLSIRVANGWALEIQHQSPLILERVNCYFGYNALEALRIIQDYRYQLSAPPPSANKATEIPAPIRQQIAQSSDRISHDLLRQNLSKLGESIYRKQQTEKTR